MYSEVARRHFEHPQHAGALADADVTGKAGVRGRGNYMVLYLQLDPETKRAVANTGFLTYGCPAAIASGSWLADWLVGKSLAEAAGVEAADVEAGLGGLPLGKEHCAPLAVSALRDALQQVAALGIDTGTAVDDRPENQGK